MRIVKIKNHEYIMLKDISKHFGISKSLSHYYAQKARVRVVTMRGLNKEKRILLGLTPRVPCVSLIPKSQLWNIKIEIEDSRKRRRKKNEKW